MPDRKLRHIAIIMDGNGRWAKRHNKPVAEGHRAGSLTVKKIAQACIKFKIPYLSLYAFSTENWRRSRSEVNSLIKLLTYFIHTERDDFHKNGVRLLVSGDISRFPGSLQQDIMETVKLTGRNKQLTINVALNYGSRNEIIQAVQKIAADVQNRKISTRHINEKFFSKYLYNGSLLPDPDILIRTSGEMRISNFLLWQIAYTELFFIPALWPDFNEKKLKSIISQYNQRERRFGGR